MNRALACCGAALLIGCGGAAHWQPRPGTSWQWQLSGAIDTTVSVAMYDVDLFVTPDSVLQDLGRRGVKIVCYFSAGSSEPARPDLGDLPADVIGSPLEGWPDEHWLDIRSDAVRTLIKKRLDLASKRGCDAVEPDNVDAYANDSGFSLTAADQLAFNRFIASEAHARGLSVGLKNDVDQVPDLVGHFDWALDEQCMEFSECNALVPFVSAHKAVFHVEYGDQSTADQVCPKARALGFDTLIKHRELDAFRIGC